MPNRLQAVNVVDFTGGLNLHVDAVQLLPTEVPELLNMEPDPRGGVRTRRGWDTWNIEPITDTYWNPRAAYLHGNSDGTHAVMLANNKKVWVGTNQVFTQLTAITAEASPHHADFVSWGDFVRIACGTGRPGYEYHGITKAVTAMTPSGGANWQDDYANPGSTKNQPQAELVTHLHGYLFTAVTNEGGVTHPNRLRYSHFNAPYAWAKRDFLDLEQGGAKITALVPFSDRLLVFKSDSVWALYGYNAEEFQLVNVSRNVGCAHNQAFTVSESACFFMSWPQGIFAYTDRGVVEVSVQIRPVFFDNEITSQAVSNVWLGWMGRRLWASLPVLGDGNATDATSAYVLDLDVGTGAWMQFKGVPRPPGPYMERPMTNQDIPLLAFSRNAPHCLILDARDVPLDKVGAVEKGFPTRLRTGWIDAGAPTHRKSWRRPDFIVNGLHQPTDIQVTVFHNFDHLNPQRQFLVPFSPAPMPALWNNFNWNDGTLYARGPTSTSVERGSTMGRAGAVQLQAHGPSGMPWGFQGVIVKFIPRRFR